MPKTKMTKSKWALVVLLMVALGATAIHRSMASNQPRNHQHHQQAQKDKPKTQPLIADGSVNPHAIPDLVAFEFLLKSIANGTGTTEPERVRARIIAENTGFNEQKRQLLVDKANGLRENLAPLNAQANEIKDRHWPNPNASAVGQLRQLQARKDKLLRDQYQSLLEQLDKDEKGVLKLRLLEIKNKVKIYEPPSVEKFKKQ